MASIPLDLHYWLVTHPKILNFKWVPGQTLASTPQFLVLTILTYLLLTLSLPYLHLPPLKPHFLKPISAVHNLILLLLSLTMAVGCSLAIFSHPPPLRHVICFPRQYPAVRTSFFWAYVFYLSKILEFIDTLLIILSKSIQRLTFLHVYHHSTVVIMCHLWLNTSQSLFPIALVTNATVHVVMYLYYLLCAVGIRPRWKRLVTDFQIVQFVFSFMVSGMMLYYHFRDRSEGGGGGGGGGGCSGMLGWCFNAIFNASLLALFLDFHGKSYDAKKRNDKKQDKRL